MIQPRTLRVPSFDGLSINVVDYGGAGPTLLLSHCTGTFARIWDPVVARLDGRFHVYAVDSRGQGDSEQPQDFNAYPWINSGRDLLAVIDALALGPGIFAAGHSAGGAHVGYAELIRPGAFARVMLIDAIIGPAELFAGENRLAEISRRRRNTFESLGVARERLGGKPPMGHWVPEALEAYLANAFRVQDDGQLVLKCPGPVEAWMYEHGGACDLFERLSDLTAPTLVIAGGDSYVAALAEMQFHRLPDAKHIALENVGHFIPQEDPDATARLIMEWFKPASA